VTIYHWFNDGWNYADGGHNVLAGHILTVTLYDAADAEIASESVTLPSGGAESFFGDHRQFYSSIISASRTAEGDYLVITNEGGNIGYKGTAVALGGDAPETWYGYEVDAEGWTFTGDWMGWVNVAFDPYIWSLALDKYVVVTDGSGWVYIPRN
jgi:hypothetical protein